MWSHARVITIKSGVEGLYVSMLTAQDTERSREVRGVRDRGKSEGSCRSNNFELIRVYDKGDLECTDLTKRRDEKGFL